MRDKKKYVTGFGAGVLCTVLVGGAVFWGYSKLGPETVLSNPQHREKLAYLESLIDKYYLEDKEEDELAEGIYTGLIYGLGDPYSAYYTAEEYEKTSQSTDGEYVGIGVTITKNQDKETVIAECYKGGPAQKAGLESGDILRKVDGEDISGMELEEVTNKIKNTASDQVTLTILRSGEEKERDFQVAVTGVEIPSVNYEMLEDHIGYIQISKFTGVTYEQYEKAFEDLKGQKMERLIVDLRNNPGGLMTSVCDVLRKILPEGLIVYTEDKYGNRTEETCDGKSPRNRPLVVLVNGDSASASEIFAGAVQDHKVGTIVGTTTYGKGIVQTLRELSDGSAVKLTVSKYYTPNGNNIHQVGIKPDVEVALDDTVTDLSQVKRSQDNQLQKGIEVVKGLS
ncbi:MAG: S41 family peptidase [Blautia sp.]